MITRRSFLKSMTAAVAFIATSQVPVDAPEIAVANYKQEGEWWAEKFEETLLRSLTEYGVIDGT